MFVQKVISPILYNKAGNLKQSNRINVDKSSKTVDTKDFIYFYPLSFGSTINNKSEDVKFEESLHKYFRLKPDKYQIEAAKYIYDGADPLILAPTGTGKTLIAEYAINKNLSEGKTTFYTTPLKALSNEKYTDFCKLYGKENVGLLTGDIKINGNAPIVIMTTEIYRNMLLGDKKKELSDRLKDVATVIYDEFHYMNDPERGEVWETSIMYTPPKVQQLLLSATAQNGEVLQKWMNRLLTEKSSQRVSQIVNVPSEERHVPLKYYVFDPKRSKTSITPLTEESYNLQKLGKALNPQSKKNLSDKQTDVLIEISAKSGGDSSAVDGLQFLMKNIDFKGKPENLSQLLVKKLGYSKQDAERAAAILCDKSERKINEKLKTEKSDKEQKRSFYSNGAMQKVISTDKVSQYLETDLMSHNTQRAFAQYSRITGGNATAKDGLLKIKSILNNSDMGVKEFNKRLINTGLKPMLADKIAASLTVVKRSEYTPYEYDLIKVLQTEDKLPAIFFNFSKKQCNNLRAGFLKTGESLLNDEEKEKASAIIKKHLDKGVFLGTNEDPSTLLTGVAVHHAGKMPSYKALVEELAQNKLIKVVFATSTLGAGINVPAKTVVFTQLTRFSGANENQDGEKFVTLTPSEFQQMAGRAGRRGKDSIGNVVVIPDKDHGVTSIYNLANSEPDPINSSFKPTYSFISHFISNEGSADNLSDAVDKSFLKERLESIGQKPYRVMGGIKKQFNAMAKVLTNPELKCFENIDGVLIPTIKGEIVAKARGVDGLLFAETILNSGLQYLTPQELACVACALTPFDDRPSNDEFEEPVHLEETVSDTLWGIDKLYQKVLALQDSEHVNISDIKLNRKDVQYISQWVNVESSNDEESRLGWEKLIKDNTKTSKTFNEGDFLKSVNRTVDILEQIKEVSRFVIDELSADKDSENLVQNMRTINNTAKNALDLLNRDPVSYEL